MKGSSQSAFSLAHCIFASSSSSVSPSSIAWFSNALIYSLKILVFRKRSAEYNRSLKSSSSFLFSSSNSSLFRSSSLRRFSLSSASIRSVFLLSASISRYKPYHELVLGYESSNYDKYKTVIRQKRYYYCYHSDYCY